MAELSTQKRDISEAQSAFEVMREEITGAEPVAQPSKPLGWLCKGPATGRECFEAPSPGDPWRNPLTPADMKAGWTARPVFAASAEAAEDELPRGWKRPDTSKEIIPSDYNGGPVLFSDGRYGKPAGHQWAPFGEVYVSLYSTLPYDEEAAAASGLLPPMDPRFLIWTELALCPNLKNAALRPVGGPEHFLMDEPLRARVLAAIRDAHDEPDLGDLVEHVLACPNINHAQLRGPNAPEQFVIPADLRDRLVSVITGDHQAALPSTRDHQTELDAQRWRAILNGGRARMLGSANINHVTGEVADENNWIHFGLEFWTSYNVPEEFAEQEKASRIWFQHAMIASADRIIERERDAS